jgi:hypothetical protein
MKNKSVTDIFEYIDEKSRGEIFSYLVGVVVKEALSK